MNQPRNMRFERSYAAIDHDGEGRQIIQAIDQEPVRPQILPLLPDEAHVLRDTRCSQRNRDDAIDFLTEKHADGYITAEELEARRTHVLESATHNMLVRVTGDLGESIDRWLAQKAYAEKQRKEAADARDEAKKVPEEKQEYYVPGYAILAIITGFAAIIAGIAFSLVHLPGFIPGIALGIAGVLALSVALIRDNEGVKAKKEKAEKKK